MTPSRGVTRFCWLDQLAGLWSGPQPLVSKGCSWCLELAHLMPQGMGLGTLNLWMWQLILGSHPVLLIQSLVPPSSLFHMINPVCRRAGCYPHHSELALRPTEWAQDGRGFKARRAQTVGQPTGLPSTRGSTGISLT